MENVNRIQRIQVGEVAPSNPSRGGGGRAIHIYLLYPFCYSIIPGALCALDYLQFLIVELSLDRSHGFVFCFCVQTLG